jgi:hypothetical protein
MEQTIKDKMIAYLKDGAVEYTGRFEHKGPLVLDIKYQAKANEQCGELYSLLDEWFNSNLTSYILDKEIYIPEYISGVVELDDVNHTKILVRISLHDTGREWANRVSIELDFDFLCTELNLDLSKHDYSELEIDDIIFDFNIVKNEFTVPVSLYIETGNRIIKIELDSDQQEMLNDYVMNIVMENAPVIAESSELEDFVSASCDGCKIIDYDVSTSYITLDWDEAKVD